MLRHRSERSRKHQQRIDEQGDGYYPQRLVADHEKHIEESERAAEKCDERHIERQGHLCGLCQREHEHIAEDDIAPRKAKPITKDIENEQVKRRRTHERVEQPNLCVSHDVSPPRSRPSASA